MTSRSQWQYFVAYVPKIPSGPVAVFVLWELRRVKTSSPQDTVVIVGLSDEVEESSRREERNMKQRTC